MRPHDTRRPVRSAFLPLLAGLLALGLAGCDDGRSTWDDLEEQGIEDPRGQGVGGLAKSVTESTTGTTAPDVVEAAELTAPDVVEAARAEAIAEEIHGARDSLRALEGYEDWLASRLGEGPEPLFLGSAESARGVGRLSDEAIVDWADLERAMLDHVYEDEEACASLARGQADFRTAVELYNGLSVEEARRRTRLVLRGLRAELAAEGPLPRAPERMLGAAFGELLDAADRAGGRGAGDRLHALIRTAEKTDAELCEFHRTILRYIPDVPPAHRRAILFGVKL